MSTSIVPRTRAHKRDDTDKLNVSQQLFIKALLADPTFNATNAARAAGYSKPGSAATKLLKNPIINAALGKAIHERMERFELTSERVIYELVAIGFFNPQDLLDENGVLLPINKLPDRVSRAIQSIKITYGESPDEDGVFSTVKNVDIHFWDKLGALNLLARHLGMFNDKLEISAKQEIKWDTLYEEGKVQDVIEQEIIDVKARAPSSQK